MNRSQRRHFLKSTFASIPICLVDNAKHSLAANDKIKLGFIGLGGRGIQLLKTCLRIYDYEIVAVCDLIQERIDKAIEYSSLSDHHPNQYTDFQKMLDREKLDAIIVATEVANHGKCVIPALKYGVHCFSEKPIESTVEKVDQVVGIARKSKAIYQVGFQRRYNPTLITTVSKCKSEIFGEITQIYGHLYYTQGVSGWVTDVGISGGVLVEQACHYMDVVTWVMNEHPILCTGIGNVSIHHPTPPTHISEDHSCVNYQFSNGIVFSFLHFTVMPPNLASERFWVFKNNGLLDLIKGQVIPYKMTNNTKEMKANIAPQTDMYSGTFEQLQSFAQHIRKKETPRSNIETARISTLTSLMGHQAIYNMKSRKYVPCVVKWSDLGSKTEPITQYRL